MEKNLSEKTNGKTNGTEIFVDLYGNCRETKPKHRTRLGDLFESFREDNFGVENLRKLKDDKERYTEKKKLLPAFTPCGTFRKRGKVYLEKHNGLVHHDVDGLTVEESQILKSRLIQDRYILYCFFSPGYGLKLGFKVDPVENDTQYKIAWQQTADYLAREHHVTVDDSGKDICRLCYFSYDDRLHLNLSADLFPVDYTIRAEKKLERKTAESNEPPEVANACAHNVINAVIGILDQSKDGNRHQKRIKAGYLLGGAVGAGWIAFTDALEAVEDSVESNTWTPEKAISEFMGAMTSGESEPLDSEDWMDEETEANLYEERLASLQVSSTVTDRSETPRPEGEAAGDRKEDKPKEERKRRGYKIKELAKWKPEPWQIYRHLGAGHFVCLFGTEGTGKTFYALDMAMSVATGLPFLEEYDVKQGPVVYICSEGGKGNIYKRIAAWMKHRGVTEPPENIIVIPSAFNLMDQAEMMEIIDIVEEDLGEDPALLVIDTLARNFQGNANSGEDMSKYIKNVDCLRNTWKTITMSVHHTPITDKNRPRNASELPGACDVMIGLSKSGETITVRNAKQKDASEFAPYCVELEEIALPEIGIDEGGLAYSSCVCVKSDFSEERQMKTEHDQLISILEDAFAKESQYTKQELVDVVRHHWSGEEQPGINKVRGWIDREVDVSLSLEKLNGSKHNKHIYRWME